MENLRKIYLDSHKEWHQHYVEGNYGGWFLIFDQGFMNKYLPPREVPRGTDLDRLDIELIDTEDNNKKYLTKFWLTYETFPGDSIIRDINYNKLEYYSLMKYIYEDKLCACNLKLLAEEAGAIIKDELCEGNRFQINRAFVEDLILYSETISKNKLEEILLGKDEILG